MLPFDNLRPDPDKAFFADGLTEELIADLSKVRAPRVISRRSAMKFKGSSKGIPEMARDLNVRHVLEGSVRRESCTPGEPAPNPPRTRRHGAGSRLGSYVLERELGAGGMATVWLAHDLKHGRPVALKVLRPELAASLGPERFLAEIRTTVGGGGARAGRDGGGGRAGDHGAGRPRRRAQAAVWRGARSTPRASRRSPRHAARAPAAPPR